MNAYLDGGVLVIRVPQGTRNFTSELQEIKDTFHSDHRHYDDVKKAWIVTNLEAYINVPAVRNALLSSRNQLSLFEANMADEKVKTLIKEIEQGTGKKIEEVKLTASEVIADVLRATGSSEKEVKETLGNAYRE